MVDSFFAGSVGGTEEAEVKPARHAYGPRAVGAYCAGTSLPLVLLGAAAGIASPFYLASVGYFQAIFRDEMLFAAQVGVVILAHFGAMLFEERAFGGERIPRDALGWRLAGLSVAVAALLVSLPGCATKVSLLLRGGCLSALGTWLFTASIQLGSYVGGSRFVNAGFGLASIAAALLVSALGFSAGASAKQAYLFYALGAAFCVVGTFVWLWVSGWFKSYDDNEEEEIDWEDDVEPAEGRRLLNQLGGERTDDQCQNGSSGYRTLLRAGAGRHDEPVDEVDGPISWLIDGATVLATTLCSASTCTLVLGAAGIFLSYLMGFAILPLFTLAGSNKAVLLHQMKCIGEGFGRLAAIIHAEECISAGKVGCGTRLSLTLSLPLRVGAMLMVIAWLLAEGKQTQVAVAPQWIVLLLVVALFCLSSYGVFMLDLDARLAVSERRRRCVVQWNRFVMVSGHVLGLLAGVALLLS